MKQFIINHALAISAGAYCLFVALILFLARKPDSDDSEAGVKLDGQE